MIFEIFLVCGNDHLLRETAEGIRRQEIPALVGCYRSIGGLMEAKHLNRADVVMIDAALTGSMTAVEALAGMLPRGRVLVCGGMADERMALTALRAGARSVAAGKALAPTIERLLDEGAVKPDGDEDEAAYISGLLAAGGLTDDLKGSRYIAEALRRIVEDPSNAENLKRDLYPAIAECCHDTAENVERSIRYAIEQSWAHMNGAQRKRLMPQCSHRPGNKMFLRQMARQVEKRYSGRIL